MNKTNGAYFLFFISSQNKKKKKKKKQTNKQTNKQTSAFKASHVEI